jgi:hypothetical protein
MKVVGDKRPGKAECLRLQQQIPKPFQKQLVVIFIRKNLLPVNAYTN